MMPTLAQGERTEQNQTFTNFFLKSGDWGCVSVVKALLSRKPNQTKDKT
jgi:hypothetical protein